MIDTQSRCFIKLKLISFIFVFHLFAIADTELYGDKYRTVPSGLLDSYKDFIGLQIQLGFADARKEVIVAPNQTRLHISQQNYLLSEPDIRSRMEEHILAGMGAVTAYIPKVDLLGESRPAEYLLSAFAKKWARQNSGQDGPNCFHTAIASVLDGFDKPRFMSEAEFLKHLDTHFVEVKVLNQPGDLLVLYSEGGIPVHAATYVGRMKDGTEILLTKNGKTAGFYLFMDLDTILGDEFLYKGSVARFFRSIRLE